MKSLSEQPDRERRYRLTLAIIGGVIGLIALGVCGTLAWVAQYAVDFNYSSPTPDIPITGTVTRIAGITLPPDARVLSQQPRKVGGAFDYRTELRPQQIYNFYLATLTLRGAWTAGGSPEIGERSGRFRFYTTYVPRLTLIEVKCDEAWCEVHVDY
jgi:hypothetical protein